MRFLVLVLALTTHVACSRDYPQTSYFIDFSNQQTSLSRGVLTFRSAEEWVSWEANERETISLLAIRSIDANCSGQIARTSEDAQAIPYEVRVNARGDAHEVVFGEKEVNCLTTAAIAEFRISPLLPRRSLFESEERSIGEVEFKVSIEPLIL